MGRIKHIMQLYREAWSEEEIQKEITDMLSNSDPRDIIKQIREVRESADAGKGGKS